MSEFPELDSFREQFNNRGKARLNRAAGDLRRDLINDATDVFRIFQARDAAQRKKLAEGIIRGAIPIHVLGGEREAPMKDDAFRATKSFMVRNEEDTERLKFHIPVPREFDDDDSEAIMRFQRPDEIYAERIRRAQKLSITVVRYVVSDSQAYEYKTVEDTQGDQQIGPEDVWAEFNRGYDPGIDTIVGLNRDLLKWRAVPQREIGVNPDTSIDL